MAETSDVERLNIEAFKGFAERADEGPLVMLNLLAFKPDGGEERYREYAAATAPFLARVGGRLLPAYRPSSDPDRRRGVGRGRPGAPTRPAAPSCRWSAPRSYQAITHLRTESLRAAALVPMDPTDASLA